MLKSFKIQDYVIAIVLLASIGYNIYLSFFKEYPIEEKIKYVTIPGIVKTTEVVQLEPKPNKLVLKPFRVVVDSLYYFKYINAKNEAERLSAYIESIKINKETVTLVNDSIIKIEVTTKSRGTVLSQFAKYKIKDRYIPEGNILPKKNNLDFYIGGFVRGGLEDNTNGSLGANILITNSKRRHVISFGYDTNNYITAGYAFKLFK